MPDQPQKVALITGAARGIGLATAHLMVGQGWRVALLDRDNDALTTAATQFDSAPLTLAHDVSNPQSAPQAIRDCLDHFGRLDALVNNAGVADFGPIEDTDFARWRQVMETNLDGVFLMSWVCTAMANLVRTGPGQTQLTRMPYSPSSAACCLLRWITAAFEVP